VITTGKNWVRQITNFSLFFTYG